MNCPEKIIYPFKAKLGQGKSKLIIDVPRTYESLKYQLVDADLVPSYYSMQAATLSMNEDDEYKVPVPKPLRMTVTHEDKLTDLEYTSNTSNIVDFMAHFNRFMEEKRPSFVALCPAFIDWVILTPGNQPIGTSMDDYVQENSNELYGNEDPSPYLCYVPPSVKHTNLVNNYRLPDNFATFPNVRARLWIAPLTKIIIRSQDIIDTLGYTDQITQRLKQYHLVNSSLHYRAFIAQNLMKPAFSKTQWKIDVTSLEITNLPPKFIVISPLMLSSPEMVANALKEALEQIATSTNFNIKLNFVQDTNSYEFNFPTQESIQVTLHLPKTVAHVLGFVDNVINRDTKSHSLSEKKDRSDTLIRSRALALDTGIIILIQNNVSSNNLVGSTKYYVATLKPTEVGTFKLFSFDPCSPFLNFDTLMYSTKPGFQELHLQLCTFDDDRNLVPLDLPCSSYLNGLIIGKNSQF